MKKKFWRIDAKNDIIKKNFGQHIMPKMALCQKNSEQKMPKMPL